MPMSLMLLGALAEKKLLEVVRRGRARAVPAPLGLLAELTHRCPLGCPYCSNPLALDKRDDELDTATWARVFREAAALGVLQVHLSGGEPAARRDLARIVKAARTPAFTAISSLRPSGDAATLAALADAGLDHVQISIQDSEAASADHIAGYKGASARKRRLPAKSCGSACRSPSTWSCIAPISAASSRWSSLALSLGASRVEIAHVQYYGWALKNRAALMPTREQASEAVRTGRDAARATSRPDRHRCGGARLLRALSQAMRRRLGPPLAQRYAGRPVLPCHAAEVIPGLEFWNVREHSLAEIWRFAGVHRVSRHGLDAGALPQSARSGSRISAAAAVRPSCSQAMRAPPIRSVIFRRITPGRGVGRDARDYGLQLSDTEISLAPDATGGRMVKTWREGASPGPVSIGPRETSSPPAGFHVPLPRLNFRSCRRDDRRGFIGRSGFCPAAARSRTARNTSSRRAEPLPPGSP